MGLFYSSLLSLILIFYWSSYTSLLSIHRTMGWLRLVGSLKVQVSFAEYRLFCRALLRKRPIILRSLLIVATPYLHTSCLRLFYTSLLIFVGLFYTSLFRFIGLFWTLLHIEANTGSHCAFPLVYRSLVHVSFYIYTAILRFYVNAF